MKKLVIRPILTIVVMTTLVLGIYAQTNLMYNSTNKVPVNKEQLKERNKQLAEVQDLHFKTLDTFYNNIFNSPKRIKFEIGLNLGFVFGGLYNYETYKSGFKYEAKEINLNPSVCAGLNFNIYWPLAKRLNLLTGTSIGMDQSIFETKVTYYDGIIEKRMNTINWSANLGLMYNPKKFLIHNYVQFGKVFSPSSDFFSNVFGIGIRERNNLLTINYRYSGGTLINVTQKSEKADQERSYSADAIFLTWSIIGPKLTPKEKEVIKKIRAKYNTEVLLVINGKAPDLISQTLIPQTNYAEPLKESIYKDFSDSTLNDLLQLALKKEEFEKADAIQMEINKRIQQNKYAKSSNEELKILLENALKMEDYKSAEDIQLEIDKRVKNKLDVNGKTNQTNTPTKKTLKELEEELKKAMDTEDYKKADEIQKEINKIK
jgi:protein-arginine kinase activator protein McsA